MIHAGLDLSRKRLDYCLLDPDGHRIGAGTVPPTGDGLAVLAARVAAYGQPVRAALEAMTGARFVHDQLERLGWDVALADAQKAKGLAPLACKTDRIDAWVLAELSRRALVPAIWLPSPAVQAARERARFRLHLVRHRSRLKHRIHSTLIAHGVPCAVSDLFGRQGRAFLATLVLPEPWRTHVTTTLTLIDALTAQITALEQTLRTCGTAHPDVPLLLTAPGIGWILGYTIAAELGDIGRFATAAHLVSYTGLCPRVYQSGERDRRGALSKLGPRYLRWAFVEAAPHAAKHPVFRARYQRMKQRLGRQRGAKVAQIDIARRLAAAVWYMLTRRQPFAPGGAPQPLAA
jgi:transposase